MERKLKYRGYEDPLDFFRKVTLKSLESKVKLTRWGLSKLDSGLYRALIREKDQLGNQLAQAIPETKKTGRGRVPEKDIKKMVEIYAECGRNFSEIGRKTGYSRNTVSKYLNALGLGSRWVGANSS